MSKTIHVVGNKVHIPDESRISKHDSNDMILFVGKMSYDPNIVATTYFANQVFPKLLEKYPSLRFVIVGANPDSRVMELANQKHIQVTGYVDSVEPYYQKATIVVAPMLTGAGIQNKILQAMSYGCCVVTTPVGAEGLNICNGEIAIADGTEGMTEVISSLLNDKSKRESMGKQARMYVIDHLSEAVICRQFWEFVDGGASL